MLQKLPLPLRRGMLSVHVARFPALLFTFRKFLQ